MSGGGEVLHQLTHFVIIILTSGWAAREVTPRTLCRHECLTNSEGVCEFWRRGFFLSLVWYHSSAVDDVRLQIIKKNSQSEHFNPLMTHFCPAVSGLFQDDKTTIHVAQALTERFNENDK